MKDYGKILSRQGEKANPLLAVLQGLVCHVDAMAEHLPFATPEAEAAKEYVESMGVNGFYEGLVVKMQLPIHTTDPGGGFCLVYNEDRSLMTELTIDDTVLALFDSQFKIFAFCRLWMDGTFQIVRRVGEQGW